MGIFDNLKSKVNFDDLKEKVKFDEIKGKATDLANSGIAKSKNLADIAKLKASSMAEEDAMKKAYVEIGKAVFASLETGEEVQIDAYIEKVKACKALIAANTAKIAALKSDGQITDAEAEAVTEVEVIEAAAEESIEELIEE